MEHCLYFFAPVERKAIGDFVHNVTEQIGKGVTKFHIVISSGGGNPKQGFGCYNFLRCIAAEVVTYNLSQIDSAAVPIFLAGSQRTIAPYSSIVVHRPKIVREAGFTQDVGDALEVFDTLVLDNENMADVFVERTGMPKEKALALLKEGRVLGPDAAIELGFATKIELPSHLSSAQSTTIRF